MPRFRPVLCPLARGFRRGCWCCGGWISWGNSFEWITKREESLNHQSHFSHTFLHQ
jgi:hypothetical protein